MGIDREMIKNRFHMNMKRISDIATFIHSGVPELKQTGLFQSEGVRADLLRSLVVFLHAAIEDAIRSHLAARRKFSFSSSADVKTALRAIGVEPSQFDDIFPAIDQLAKRRIQIVHFADLKVGQSDNPSPWGLVDEWLLVQWNLAVLILFRRLRKATGRTNAVEDRALEGVEAAIKLNVQFAHKMLEIPKLSQNKRMDGIRELVALGERMQEVLRLDVQMFLGPDGQPIEGAV